MSSETMQGSSPAARSPVSPSLRLWPGLALVIGLWLMQAWAVTGEFSPQKFFMGKLIAPMVVTAGLIVWWLFASRLSWFDRWLGVGAVLAVAAATILIAGTNFPAMAMIIYVLPVLATTWVGWLLLSMPLPWTVRRVGLVFMFIAIGTVCSLLRLEGMDGSFAAKFHWRWVPTGEAILLSELKTYKPADVVKTHVESLKPSDWPAFRGTYRDGQLRGVWIDTNWDKSPPREMWRRRVGPGWSSFAVVGSNVYTQEQRSDDELVVCYDAKTGAEIWSHSDATRFTEVVAGAGPRATPTFHEGRIYALGANGTLNCLDAASGKRIWSKNIIADTAAKIPQWGFSSSPLILHGIVSVFAGGANGKSVVAYRIENGDLAWTAGTGHLSYCSPQPATLCGVEQILFPTEEGLTSFDPTTGNVLWMHEWLAKDIARVVQPAILADGDVLIGTGMNVGIRRISPYKSENGWVTSEHWTSREIKPYYNDFVVSGDSLYGFDGPIFLCVNVQDGKKSWKTRGYGNGQVLLLAEQKLLLILSETGEVALVEANPKEYRELAKFPAISGKTWNHPVVANGTLFVRNAEEFAAFELKLLSDPEPANDAKSSEEASADKQSEPTDGNN